MSITGEMRWPFVETELTTSLARNRRVSPHRGCSTVVCSPRRLESATEATATPWRPNEVTGVLMARSLRS